MGTPDDHRGKEARESGSPGLTPESEDKHAKRLEVVRRELVLLVRRKKARIVEWSPEEPIEWRHGEYRDPRSGEWFTEPGAWDFIAELLEAGQPLEEIDLRKPPGKKGYVIRAPAADSPLYIKLRLGSGKVIGRSFHEDRPG